MSMQPVRGTHDLMGDQFRSHLYILKKARDLALNYGFQPMSTPLFEFSSVFKRTLGEESDIVNKEMYTFEDRGGESLTLRPEGTAPVARAFISEGMAQFLPVKLFYEGPMFRYERPQKGRYRQFHQWGVELLGVAQPQADVECISLASNFFQQMNLQKKVKLHLNTIGDPESRQTYKNILIEYFSKYKNELSEDSLRRLQTNPLRILDSKDKNDQKLVLEAPVLKDSLNSKSSIFFDSVIDSLEKLNISFVVDPLLVRGLDYYCHTVFEFKTQALGAQDAVLSGGRYDSLIKDMGGPDTPGIGFAAGVERLCLLAEDIPSPPRPFTFIPVGEDAEAESLKLCHALRIQGLPMELGYSGNLSKRMKKAHKNNSQGTLIIGNDELQRGVATWKDLDTGNQQEVKLEELTSFLQQKMSDGSSI